LAIFTASSRTKQPNKTKSINLKDIAMSRKRSISTKISLDKRINSLAVQGGDFAALLYTWMIPHAEDDARLPGDPDEVLMTVMPGRRDKSVKDIIAALELMDDLGLIIWNRAESYIEFPTAKFYEYQSYIPTGKRRGSATNNEDQRKTPKNAEDGKKTPLQARAYPSPSPSSSPSLTPSLSPSPSPSRVPALDDERESSFAALQEDDEATPETDDAPEIPAPSELDEKKRRNGIKGAVISAWGHPDTAERGAWDSGITQLFDADYTPQQVRDAIPLYEQRRPKAARTPSGLARNIRAVLSEARASPLPATNIPKSSKPAEPTPQEWEAMNAKILDALSQ
jgi:hypothetical protein